MFAPIRSTHEHWLIATMLAEDMPSTSRTSDVPRHPRRRKRATGDESPTQATSQYSHTANRHRLWLISSAALLILLVSYFNSDAHIFSADNAPVKSHGRAKTVTLRTAYSGRCFPYNRMINGDTPYCLHFFPVGAWSARLG